MSKSGSVPAAWNAERIVGQLLPVYRARHTLWPDGYPHQLAMRLALESGIGLALSRATKGDAAAIAVMTALTEGKNAGPLRALLDDASAQEEKTGSPLAAAAMHLRAAAAELLLGDAPMAEMHFAGALALDPQDHVTRQGLAHLRRPRPHP